MFFAWVNLQIPGPEHSLIQAFVLPLAMGSKTPSWEDSENFWKVEAEYTDFWDDYVWTRPSYDSSFYDLIYKHHAAHSSSYGLAHDVGSGAGQVAAELASHFSHVVASDNDGDHLLVTKKRLADSFDASKVSFIHARGEDLAERTPTDSADMIMAAECMVLMDPSEGLRSFAKVLKPGGTLATWFYGRPTFTDPHLFSKGQPVLDEIMDRLWTKVIRGSGPKREWGFKRCADAMASWLDYVSFPADTWVGVQRIKHNTHATLPFFGEKACGFNIEPVSRVAKGEKVIVHNDPKFWMNRWDVNRLREYFRVLFPGFKEANGDGDAEIDNLFAMLGKLMGGERAVHEFTWPCSLLVATRR